MEQTKTQMLAKYQILLPAILWHLLLRICTTTALTVMVGLSALAQNDRPPPPPPPPPEPKVEEIFIKVPRMPRFPGCEDQPTNEQKDSCASKKLKTYIYKQIIYPQEAIEKKITGTVKVSFIVNTNGSVTVGEVVEDIGGNCGDEVLRVIGLMNKQGVKFNPARGRGRPVRVQFVISIDFTEEMLRSSRRVQNDEPPPPSIPPRSGANKIATVVEQMPRFPGCEDLASRQQKDSCSRVKLEAFVYSEIVYPDKAKELGITGTVKISFVVNPNGTVTVGEVIEDIGGGCGEEALRVLGLINEKGYKFTPTGSRLRPVRVRFKMPIDFTEEMLQRSKSN